MKPFAASLIFLLTTGCAGSLTVKDGNGNEIDGIPVRAPVVVLITTTTRYAHIDGKTDEASLRLCQSTESQSTKVLPLGNPVYVNFMPSHFAKTEFAVEFNDEGLAKSISLNSDPSSIAESTTGLLAAILPYIAEQKGAASLIEAGTGSAEKDKAKHCLPVSSTISVSQLSVANP